MLVAAGLSNPEQSVLKYEGEFKDDLRDGRGVLTQQLQGASQVNVRYEGEYKEDRRHG